LLTDAGGTLFFRASDGVHGTELWKSDGTEDGTTLVKDIRPDLFSAVSSMLATFDGTLFFAADDGIHGRELWRSDGTEEGTALVQDVNPGPTRSDVRDAMVVGSRLYFAADDGVAGHEPWVGRVAILANEPERAIAHLREEVLALGLPRDTERSLTAKLDAAGRAQARGAGKAAVHLLLAFAGEMEGLSPSPVPEAAGADLIAFAQDIANLVTETRHGRTRPDAATMGGPQLRRR
jgi:ELWxxDGT repeat protein